MTALALAAGAAAPLRRAWYGPRTGPATRVLLAVLALPVALNAVLPGTRPAGVLLYGAVTGSLYGLIAVGLILVYRANRVVNFAQAGLGAVPAVVALLLITNKGWPYPAAVAVLAAGSLALGAAVEFLFIRRFAHAPRLILAVVTIGVSQLLAVVEFHTPGWMTGDVLPPNDFPTPFSGARFHLGGTVFSGDHVATVLAVAALVGGLGAFFRFTRAGIAVRAAAENADRASLLGVPVKRLSTLVWMLAALLSGVGIFLRAPLVGLPLGTIIGPSMLLFALAAAMVGRMERMPTAFLAGVAIGVIDFAFFYSTRDSVVSDASMLPIILAALLLQRRRASRAEDTGVSTWRSVKEFRPVPAQLRGVREVVVAGTFVRLALAAIAVGLPFLVGPLYRNDASLLLVFAMVGISLVLLTGWAGQISLGQFAFAGLGAAVAGGLAANHGTDFFVAVFAAGLVGAAIAVAVGLPALRLDGLFLAVTTLAFAAATNSFLLNRRYFGWLLPEPGRQVHRPKLYGRIDTAGDLAFYYLCLVFTVLAAVAAHRFRGTRSGRVLVATRDNPRAAQAYGVNLARTKLAAFALSGFIAAVAGALLAYQQGAVDRGAFPAVDSLKVFAMTVVGGLTSVGGAVSGAAFVIGVQRFPVLRDIELVELLATGVGLMVLLLFFPGGFSELAYRARDSFLRWVAARHRIHVPSLVADGREGDEAAGTTGAPPAPPGGDEVPEPDLEVIGQEAARARRSRARVRAVDGEGALEPLGVE